MTSGPLGLGKLVRRLGGTASDRPKEDHEDDRGDEQDYHELPWADGFPTCGEH